MAKSFAVFMYAILALGLLILLVSYSPTGPHHRHQYRRLKLRLASAPPAPGSHHRIPFDPLIADIEHRREDREWEKAHYSIPPAPGEEAQPEWEDFMNAEDYINDEERFNVTGRIVLLFPKIDVSPADGFVSLEELTEWNLKQAEGEVMHRTQRDMELYDKNRDGFISFQEYVPPSWARGSDDSHGAGWWSEDHFNASDMDGHGLLNLTEFNDFLHPSDSSNPRLIQWLCKQEIRERDTDKDGKLNFQEFFHGLFDSIRNYDEGFNQSVASSEVPAKKLFEQLDQDNDGFISEDELRPVIGNIHPPERYYAKQQADYMLSQADTDKDGRLSLLEMIEHPYVFYSAIFSDDEDYEYHDEFR